MKKIIQGRVYDTSTAHMVGEASGVPFQDRMRRFREALYKKRTGEYFLAGSGGPLSQWAVPYSPEGGLAEGSGIRPLTWEQARDWGERYMSPEAYVAEFGDADEAGEGQVVISVRVKAASKAALDREAARTGRTKGAILDELLAGLGAG